MRTLLLFFGTALVLFSSAAQADEALLAQHRSAADACWASVQGQSDRVAGCGDLVAEACSATPEGQSNLGMSQCLYAEAAFWDEKLNEEWAGLIKAARAEDARDRDYEPEIAVREERLRAAQRAWIAFRDAQCAFDYALAGGGSIRQLYYPSCLASLTRDRVEDFLGIALELGL